MASVIKGVAPFRGDTPLTVWKGDEQRGRNGVSV